MRTLAEIKLADNDRLAIERAAAILREQFDVERVILFGSKARGDDHPDSDIDLLILTRCPATSELKHRIHDVMYDLQLEHDVWFGKLVIAAEDWEHGLYQVLPIKDEVERDGVAA